MINRLFFISLILLFFSQASLAETINVATWNVRINVRQDSINGNVWGVRRNAIVDVAITHDFDIMGVQEDYKKELDELNSLLSHFERVGFPNHENGRLGSFNSIFYKKEKFVLLNSGMFYFAEDEDNPVLGWNGKYIRSCTWASFKLRNSNETVWFFNVHTDYAGGEVERESAKMMLRKIRELAGEKSHAILMGDLNFNQYALGYRLLKESGLVYDGFDVAKKKIKEHGTFNGFDLNRESDDRLDHIFVTNKIQVLEYNVILDTYIKNGEFRFPSDHYPVVLKLKLL